MERLTQEVGFLGTVDKAISDISFLQQVVLKLAYYEDIGLEPSEIKKLLEKLEKYEYKYGSLE